VQQAQRIAAMRVEEHGIDFAILLSSGPLVELKCNTYPR
jgi:hypothetical protein